MDKWVIEKELVVSENEATHYCYGSKNYFKIDTSTGREFYERYCEILSRGENPGVCEVTSGLDAITLTYEVNLTFSRAKVFNNSTNELLRSIDSYIYSIISVIQDQIKHCYQTDKERELIAAYLKRSKSPLIWTEETVEFYARIIFPYSHIPREQIKRFYLSVTNQLSANNALSKLIAEPLNPFTLTPYSSVLYEMYGSYIQDELSFHALYGIIGAEIQNMALLESVFKPCLNSLLGSSSLEKELEYYLPIFYSNFYSPQPMRSKEADPVLMAEVLNGNVDKKLERVSKLLGMIKSTRCNKYWSWIDIGNALHTMENSEKFLSLWINKTKEGNFKTEEDCRMEWEHFEQMDVTEKTLEWFASKDSPREYEEFRNKELDELFIQATEEKTHKAIAKAFHTIYINKFLCSNYETSKWYIFKKTHWVRMDGIATLMEYLNEDFQKELLLFKERLIAEKNRTKSREIQMRNDRIISNIGTLILNLSENPFKKTVCEELKVYYSNKKISSSLDMMGEFIATPSYVIDMRGGGPADIREGKPEDYCTRITKQPYKFYPKNDSRVVFVRQYMKQLFRSRPLRNYVKGLLGAMVKGTNIYKILAMFNGSGDNSKSAFVRMIESALGSYCAKIPITILTGKRGGADNPTPALLHTRGTHVVFMQEAGTDTIRSEVVKELVSGGYDTVMVRELFQKGEDIQDILITFIPIIVTNKFPTITDTQEAIWNRIRLINFSSKWTVNAPDSEQEQMEKGLFKVDRHFEEKIKRVAGAFLYMMVHYYNKYTLKGIKEPEDVLEATERYRISNNIFIHFTSECVKQVKDLEGNVDYTKSVTLDELYNAFKLWYIAQINQYKRRTPSKTEFKGEIEAIWKITATDGVYKGVELNVEVVQGFKGTKTGGSLLW